MKKLIVVAALVLTLVAGVVSTASADDTAAVKLFNNPFRQSIATQAYWITGNTASALDDEASVRVFDDPFARSDLRAVLVMKGGDIFSGPYTMEVDKLYTVVENQIRVGRPGAAPEVGPQAVLYTIDGNTIYSGAYKRFDSVAFTIADNSLYRGPYVRLDTLVFTAQGDIKEVLPLLPILADKAF